MATLPIVAINDSTADIPIADMGFTLLVGEQRILTDTFPRYVITGSSNLRTEVENQRILINDGTNTLSLQDALDHITYETEYEDITTMGAGYHIGPTPPEDPSITDGWVNTADDNILYIYDENRGKWLSANRKILVFAKSGEVSIGYLNVGQLTGSNIGYLTPRGSTITALTSRSRTGDNSKNFNILADSTNVYTISCGTTSFIDNTANVNIQQRDLIQVYTPKQIEFDPSWYDEDWLYRKRINITGNIPLEPATYDSDTSGSGSGTSHSVSHTIGSDSDRLLVAFVTTENPDETEPPDITSVTYNGVAMTQAANEWIANGKTNRYTMFYMLESDLPTTGAYTLAANFNGSNQQIIIGAMSFSGVSQTTGLHEISTNEATDQASITTAININRNNSLVVTMTGNSDTDTSTPNSGQTEAYDFATGDHAQAGGYDLETDVGLTNYQWTADGGVAARIFTIAAEFHPAIQSYENFPLLVEMNTNDLNKARPDGNDILFTSVYDGTTIVKYDHEIEYFDSSSSLVAWVRIPSISADTELYIYYGNSSATDQQNAAGLWGEYEHVYHMRDFNDSAGSANLTNDGTILEENGQIDGCREFGGDGDDLSNTTVNLNGYGSLTLSCWVQADGIGVDDGIFYSQNIDGDDEGISLRYDDAGFSGGANDCLKLSVETGNGFIQYESAANTQTTEWQFLTMRWQSGEGISLFIDGVEDVPSFAGGTLTGTTANTDRIIIGRGAKDGGGTTGWDGLIDEVRFTSEYRSAGWIEAEYNNQLDPSTFISFATEEAGIFKDVFDPIITVEVAWRYDA